MKYKTRLVYTDIVQKVTRPLVIFVIFAAAPAAVANDVFTLVLHNHVFTPSELVIPSNKKVRIVIENRDQTAEEFDSFDLNRERVLFGSRKTTIFVGPLSPGRYEYFGEYHPNSARGVVIVEEKE